MLTSGLLTCLRWATPSCTHAKMDSFWPGDLSTGLAGQMAGGQANLPSAKVLTLICAVSRKYLVETVTLVLLLECNDI